MASGIDYSFAHPTPSAIKAAGYSFVLRYYGGDASLTPAEAQQLSAAGLLIGCVFERGSQDMLNPSLWSSYGAAAKAAAQQCSQPTWAPIFAGADFDVQAGEQTKAVLLSLQAFGTAIAPYPAGLYGGFLACAAAAFVGCRWLWQTEAWSGGKVQAGIGILQKAQGASVGGVQVDVDIDEGVLAEHGLWTPGAAPPVVTREAILAAYGPTWYTHYGFAAPPAGSLAYPEIAQGKVYGESFVAAA